MKKVVAVKDQADYTSEGVYKSRNNNIVIAASVVGALLVGSAGGFFAGYQIGSNNDNVNRNSSQADMNDFPGGMMGGGQFGMGGFGTVTAVSGDSITVKDQRQDEETTYTITSNTEVTDGGDKAAIGDIKVGDTVMVRTDDSSDSTNKTATSIQLNPSFGGARGNTQSSQSSDSNDGQSSI